MEMDERIVIIGAGLFGLCAAHQLATEGYRNIFVLDRQVPPVVDGSSSDISRVIRFDYADEDYMSLARDAHQQWLQSPRYKGIFFPTPYILVSGGPARNESWISKTTAALSKHKLYWSKLDNAATVKSKFPILSGTLAGPDFFGYHNSQAGWADANKAIMQLRNDCLRLGVSFICGKAGTVMGFDTGQERTINGVKTLAGTTIEGDRFVLAAGAWTSRLVPMYNSTLSTAQALGYIRLNHDEMEKYRSLPIYANFSTGWFNFPPHPDSNMLKMAVHGWGYTRSPSQEDRASNPVSNLSSPPLRATSERSHFVPADGEKRLREGLRETLPELAERPFEKLALCWYTDTPTGDFIIDFHPDYRNLLVASRGSGQGVAPLIHCR